jgi:delta-1-pyrroline-5-carboxylate synthetase
LSSVGGGGGILQSLSSEERKQILLTVAEALVANEARIKTENEADVEAAQLSGIAKSLIGRLTIKPGKVSHSQFQFLSFQKDPFLHVVIMLLPCEVAVKLVSCLQQKKEDAE